MSEAAIAHRGVEGGVTPLQDPIAEIAQTFLASSLPPQEFARRHQYDRALLYWLKRHIDNGDLRWSTALAQAHTGQPWRTVTLAFKPEAGASYPHYVVAPYGPRRCDVTDRWFVPTDPRQRFAPGLSEAVKRAARRNLARARARWAQEGDWGR